MEESFGKTIKEVINMCKAKRYKRIPNTRIDKCMRNVIEILKLHNIKTVSCCCGHRKYPMTIVCSSLGSHYELFTGKHINKKRKFYKRDKQGYYYIPEVLKAHKEGK